VRRPISLARVFLRLCTPDPNAPTGLPYDALLDILFVFDALYVQLSICWGQQSTAAKRRGGVPEISGGSFPGRHVANFSLVTANAIEGRHTLTGWTAKRRGAQTKGPNKGATHISAGAGDQGAQAELCVLSPAICGSRTSCLQLRSDPAEVALETAIAALGGDLGATPLIFRAIAGH